MVPWTCVPPLLVLPELEPDRCFLCFFFGLGLGLGLGCTGCVCVGGGTGCVWVGGGGGGAGWVVVSSSPAYADEASARESATTADAAKTEIRRSIRASNGCEYPIEKARPRREVGQPHQRGPSYGRRRAPQERVLLARSQLPLTPPAQGLAAPASRHGGGGRPRSGGD